MVNNAGESPKDLAKRYGQQNCVDLLGGNSGKLLDTHHKIATEIFEGEILRPSLIKRNFKARLNLQKTAEFIVLKNFL